MPYVKKNLPDNIVKFLSELKVLIERYDFLDKDLNVRIWEGDLPYFLVPVDGGIEFCGWDTTDYEVWEEDPPLTKEEKIAQLRKDIEYYLEEIALIESGYDDVR